jgi:hypothetical protein
VARAVAYVKDGTRALVLEPDDLMVRLVAAVPHHIFTC